MSTEQWWRASRWTTNSIPVAVRRYTDNSVWLIGGQGRPDERCARLGVRERYFPTRVEALEFMRDRQRAEVDSLKNRTHAANSRLGEIESELRKEQQAAEDEG